MKTLMRDPFTLTGRARTKDRHRTDVISKDAEKAGRSHTAGGMSNGAAVLESSLQFKL